MSMPDGEPAEAQPGMLELESVSHQHEFGPWREFGTEQVMFTRFYVQVRECVDPRCRWKQWARSAAGSTQTHPSS